MGGIFPKYKLTEKQIRGIANIVLHEQGSIAGWYAEASQIANRTDIRGDQYATGENAVKTVTSGWYAKGKARYNAGTSNKTVIAIVKRVFCDGYRTLPRYIDEHDCMSDISTVKNGKVGVKHTKSKWKMHTTIVKNKMGSTYTFYSFPGGYKTGVDPFGYTSKKYREKWGDFCYTVAQAQAGSNTFDHALPDLPERGYFKRNDGIITLRNQRTQIMRLQKALNWSMGGKKGFDELTEDGKYGKKTEDAVRLYQTVYLFRDINGKWGKLCNAKIREIKR